MFPTPTPKVKYTGVALPGIAETVTLFDTSLMPMANWLQLCGLRRFVADIAHNQAGTINFYKSADRGATWLLVGTQAAPVPAAGTSLFDILVEPYGDWKIEWVNGGAAQTTWAVDMALTPNERDAAS